MKIAYAPSFIRQFNKLEPALQDEVVEKITLFEKNPKDPQLKGHKLHGRLNDRHSFSVNYSVRIVFSYITKQTAVLLAVGDHDVYK